MIQSTQRSKAARSCARSCAQKRLVAVLGERAEQVLEPLAAPVWIALDVEEDVARGRRRQPREAAAGGAGQALVQRHVGVTALHLQPRLLAEPGERGGRDAGQRDAGRHVGQLGDPSHPGRLERDRLRARDPGDQREVVVGAAPVAAARPPVAVGAVLDGVGVRRRCALAVGLQGAEEAALDAVGVGLEVARAERARLVRAEHHVHALGRDPLDLPGHRGVEEQLEDHVRLGVRRELGVGRLVGVRPEVRRAAHLEQEVGGPAPVAGHERGLVDDVAAGPHRLGGRLRRAVAGRDLLDVEAALAQLRQVGALVLAPALGHQLGVRARDPLQQDLALGAREVQRRPVLAGEEVVEVARGEQEASAALQHRRHLPGRSGRMRGREPARPGRCTGDMRTPLVLLAIAAVALGPAAAASAKEIDKVKVCGADGCHDVTDRTTMAITDGGPPTGCARRGDAVLPDQGQHEGAEGESIPGWSFVWVPAAELIGLEDGTWTTAAEHDGRRAEAGHARHRAAAGVQARAARADPRGDAGGRVRAGDAARRRRRRAADRRLGAARRGRPRPDRAARARHRVRPRPARRVGPRRVVAPAAGEA